MAQSTATLARPKYTGFMVGWLVFLGVYQIFFAGLFGGLFLGANAPFLVVTPPIDVQLVRTVMGIVAFVTAYGLWKMQWWGLVLGFILEGIIIAVVLEGFMRYFWLNETEPIVWLVLDFAFIIFNLYWGLPRNVRDAYLCQPQPAPATTAVKSQ